MSNNLFDIGLWKVGGDMSREGLQDDESATLNVNINERTANQLRRIKTVDDQDYTEILRRAVSAMDILYRQQEKGRKILVVSRNGRCVREVILER